MLFMCGALFDQFQSFMYLGSDFNIIFNLLFGLLQNPKNFQYLGDTPRLFGPLSALLSLLDVLSHLANNSRDPVMSPTVLKLLINLEETALELICEVLHPLGKGID